MTQIGTVIDGKYEILKEIGRGGMSIVYLAMDKRLNKQWAVKEIRKKGNGKNDEVVVNSLLAEANLIKRLDHPALPRIVDIIDNGITIYIVMDYIEGESLDKILLEYGAQKESAVIEWAKQICDALSYLHGQKPPIIYRDMKPANVMLKPEGNIKIIKFVPSIRHISLILQQWRKHLRRALWNCSQFCEKLWSRSKHLAPTINCLSISPR